MEELRDILPEEAEIGESSNDVNQNKDENDILDDLGQIAMSGSDDRVELAESFDISKGDDEFVPEVGMVFKTVNEAYDFYNRYAYLEGFGITRQHARRRKGKQYEFTFTCAKSGKPKVITDFGAKRIKRSKKTNCRARMTIRAHCDGLFYVEYLILEHNHPCTPGKVQLYRSHRYLSLDAKKQLNDNDHSSQPTTKSFQLLSGKGDDLNVSIMERYCKSYVPEARFSNLEEGDAHIILDYFHRMHKENPRFFFMMDLDGEGRLRNVFWATSRSRVSYTYFNDVVSFDTTSLKNKYHMPFATFVGVDHHGSLVLFGAALLSDSRMETYTWLFKAWLACMDDLAPKAIITDQNKEIGQAVAQVFPNARHRLCVLRILEEIPKKFAGNPKCKDIKARIDDLVYDSLKEGEFEERWKGMIFDYNLEENEWLMSLYEERHKWVPAFVKTTFWAGISSICKSESVDSYFECSVTSQTSLQEFLNEYEKALKRRYEKETLIESCCLYEKQPTLISRSRLEKHFAALYTTNMFRIFQIELRKCMDCTISLVKKDGPISTFVVYENVQDQVSSYVVVFDDKETRVQCVCCLYEFKGILCAHVIMVLREMGIHTVPSGCVCDRWRKNFKQNYHKCATFVHVVPRSPMERYDKLYSWCLKLVHDIVETGALSSDRYEFLVKLLTEAQMKLNDYDSNRRMEEADLEASIDHQKIVFIEDVENGEVYGKHPQRNQGASADQRKAKKRKVYN